MGGPGGLSAAPLITLNGTAASRYGASVSTAGDVDSDGYADVLIGAPDIATAYLHYGSAVGIVVAPDVTVSEPPVGDLFGSSVCTAGDVNGDGYSDLFINAKNAGGLAGASYVVFGMAGGFGSAVDLGSLSAGDGFRIDGIDGADYSGYSLASAGDVNGDGIDDVLIGAWGGDGAGNARTNSGEAYVVFGRTTSFGTEFDLATLDGANGVQLHGADQYDVSGWSVSSAGDVNGDGFDDVLIGAWGAEPNGVSSGSSYVVFGHGGTFAAAIDLGTLDGSDGFRVDGNFGERSGYAVSAAGDMNGDGYADLVVGAPFGEHTYLVFGKANGFAPAMNLDSMGPNDGVTYIGIDLGDDSGWALGAAGDVNGDGFDDLIIGARGGDAAGNARQDAGESYVIFGRDFRSEVIDGGTVNDDTIAGTGDADLLIGGLGNDNIDGASGIDVLMGGAGDDVFYYDGLDRKIDGGSGNDTLRPALADQGIDLGGLAGTVLVELERIDLGGAGANAVTFDTLDLLNLSRTTNQLMVLGDAGDSVVSIGQGWALDGGGPVDIGGVLFNSFQDGAAHLYVQEVLDQTLS
jgi:hypothetical protein